MENPASGAKGDQELEAPQSTADMTTFMGHIFNLVQFENYLVAGQISLDEIESKIDDLEKSVNDLKSDLGTESTAKIKLEDTKLSDETA
ncbi:heat shock factor-binding protein 1-like isoform X2 [Carex littledalei]|uniref:Heat shock factor-binding protein 1-like isoform X2 n=1 Tax=Carex littledalei TaxID=544730 RepID=A0A833R4I0_9POAL|nr:heat shock factor-binding protein 1-like isoform X2 [Carex littledalei]